MISYEKNPEAFRHQAVLVQHGNVSAWIDKRIAKLVKSLWETGLQTELSCEECDPGIAFIAFTLGYCERFCRRLIGIDVDWEIFERLDPLRSHQGAFLNGFERGYFPFTIPVWSKPNRDDIMFPLAYIEKFEEAAGKPELEQQGPKSIFHV